MVNAALTTTEAQLVRGLYVARERWGWEFVDGGPPVPSPLADRPPAFTPPALPDLSAMTEQRSLALRSLWVRMLLPVVFVVFGVLLARDGGLFFVPAGFALALLAGLPAMVRHGQLARARRRAPVLASKARQQHETALASWQAEVGAHQLADDARREAASRFYPITTPAAAPRVDVFGGDGDGWASLLATAGSSLLASGTGVLLVDLSERTVGGGLARVVGQAGCPVESWDLPPQLDEVALLDGLGPREAGELVADAFEPIRDGEADQHRHALHADLITGVSEVLGGQLTFRRIAEGLRILEGLDDGSAATALTPSESAALVARMNSFGRGERVPDELRYLRSSLEALCPPVPTGGPGGPGGDGWGAAGVPGQVGLPAGTVQGGWPGGGEPRRLAAWWPVRGLRVLATSSRASATRHKELADRLVVQAVLHQLRRRPPLPSTGRDMLVVAGADQLGRPVIGGLSRHAEVAGVRLVLLFERLADDAERMLGAQGGATIFMRLGNGKDAATAAEYIGRGYRFVMSQVTAQVGRSFTVGDSDSLGYQDGTSDTTGTSGGSGRTYDGTRLLPWLQNTSTNTGWQESVTTSRSRTWQRTTNTSVADSTTDGTTSSRVYEFLVEPTTLQTLPTTAFLLVRPVDGAGRVTPGDCNPGTVLLPRVSPVDRWTASRTPTHAALPTAADAFPPFHVWAPADQPAVASAPAWPAPASFPPDAVVPHAVPAVAPVTAAGSDHRLPFRPPAQPIPAPTEPPYSTPDPLMAGDASAYHLTSPAPPRRPPIPAPGGWVPALAAPPPPTPPTPTSPTSPTSPSGAPGQRDSAEPLRSAERAPAAGPSGPDPYGGPDQYGGPAEPARSAERGGAGQHDGTAGEGSGARPESGRPGAGERPPPRGRRRISVPPRDPR
jgi:hypothetical protein